ELPPTSDCFDFTARPCVENGCRTLQTDKQYQRQSWRWKRNPQLPPHVWPVRTAYQPRYLPPRTSANPKAMRRVPALPKPTSSLFTTIKTHRHSWPGDSVKVADDGNTHRRTEDRGLGSEST